MSPTVTIIIKKKIKIWEYIIYTAVISFSLVLLFLASYVAWHMRGVTSSSSPNFGRRGSVSPIFIFILVTGEFIYFFIKTKLIEFEYELDNGSLKIDKVVGRGFKRKTLFCTNVSSFDIIARKSSQFFTPEFQSVKRRYEFVSSKRSDDIFFAFLLYEGEKTLLFFEPDKTMLDRMKAYTGEVYEQ